MKPIVILHEYVFSTWTFREFVLDPELNPMSLRILTPSSLLIPSCAHISRTWPTLVNLEFNTSSKQIAQNLLITNHYSPRVIRIKYGKSTPTFTDSTGKVSKQHFLHRRSHQGTRTKRSRSISEFLPESDLQLLDFVRAHQIKFYNNSLS